jgi:putative acetyltransferase
MLIADEKRQGLGEEMILRQYSSADAEALARIYREAALITGCAGYTAEQAELWASFADDEAFYLRLNEGVTLVAQEHEEIIGFGQLSPSDHIALLMTAPRHGRRGVATAIVKELEQIARKAGERELHTEASRIARLVFERLGFGVTEEELSEFKGMQFIRYRMSKDLQKARV